MEGLLVIALGALAVIAAPLVPGVRPLAKSAVKGGMALGGVAAAAAVAAGQQWDHLADKMGSRKSEVDLPVVEGTATPVGDAAADAAHATSETAAAVAEEAKSTAASTAEAVTGAVNAAAEQATAVFDGDNLTKISGIGPKTATVLASAGITTYAQLAAATEGGLREILESAGPRYRLLDPTTWPDQAAKRIADESAQ
jgi:predicted flap endonuclease-1-like 5' DNA nuclease